MLAGKYLALLIMLAIALLVGDTFGSIGGRPFDWSAAIPFGLVTYVYFKHYLFLGLLVGFCGVLTLQFLGLTRGGVFLVTTLVGLLYVTLEFVNVGELEFLSILYESARFLPPYLVGFFSVFGAWSFILSWVKPTLTKGDT